MRPDTSNLLSLPHRKTIGGLPLFEPLEGSIIAEPPEDGEGSWAGAPSAIFDDASGTLFLSVRKRTRVLDHGRAGRGGQTTIYASTDGDAFEEVWTVEKSQFEALSIEKSCLAITPDGRFRLYVSYTALFDYRWRIDVMEASHPSEFDPAERVNVLSPDNTGTDGVKDPVVFNVGGLWHLYANCAERPVNDDTAKLDRMHREGNCFVSGEVPCPSGLAVSHDGIHFQWQGVVLSTGAGWDRHLARFTSLIHTPPFFTCIYDGRPNTGAAYCETPGLAITFDMRTFRKLGHEKGLMRSPHGRGGLRYIDGLIVGSEIFYFYEMARPDAAHHLRRARVPLGQSA